MNHTGKYEFQFNKDLKEYHAKITKSAEVLILPSTRRGYPVTCFWGFEDSPEGFRETKEIIIPEGVKSLEGDVFSCFFALERVHIPRSLEEIGDHVFGACYSIKEFIIDEGNEHFTTIEGNLYSKDMKTLINVLNSPRSAVLKVPEGVTHIRNGAITWNNYITKIELPDSVQRIDVNFPRCPRLAEICVDEKNEHYATDNGILYSKDYKKLYYAPCAISQRSISLHPSLISIEACALQGCKFSTVKLPKGLRSIGFYAFKDCESLENIILPKGLERICSDAFSKCSSLQYIKIPISVTHIDGFPFSECERLSIDCEVSEPPSGWEYGKNFAFCPVRWGVK